LAKLHFQQDEITASSSKVNALNVDFSASVCQQSTLRMVSVFPRADESTWRGEAVFLKAEVAIDRNLPRQGSTPTSSAKYAPRARRQRRPTATRHNGVQSLGSAPKGSFPVQVVVYYLLMNPAYLVSDDDLRQAASNSHSIKEVMKSLDIHNNGLMDRLSRRESTGWPTAQLHYATGATLGSVCEQARLEVVHDFNHVSIVKPEKQP
jgi:hypothetical protein